MYHEFQITESNPENYGYSFTITQLNKNWVSERIDGVGHFKIMPDLMDSEYILKLSWNSDNCQDSVSLKLLLGSQELRLKNTSISIKATKFKYMPATPNQECFRLDASTSYEYLLCGQETIICPLESILQQELTRLSQQALGAQRILPPQNEAHMYLKEYKGVLERFMSDIQTFNDQFQARLSIYQTIRTCMTS